MVPQNPPPSSEPGRDQDDHASRADRPEDTAAPGDPWAGIVAGLPDLAALDLPSTRRPGSSDQGPEALDEPAPQTRRPAGPRDWPAGAEVEELEEAQSHFVPPTPPPVLGGDPLTTLAWALVALAPAIVLVLLLVAREVPVRVGQGAGLLFACGLGILFWRMPRDRDEDDPGAEV